MPRIAKADVHQALALAAKAIVEAGGPGGRTTRAELDRALSALPTEQRGLVDLFFKYIDNRDPRKDAEVTAKDVSRAVEYAKTHLIAKYDLNSNGLSKDEVAKMSLTGKRAVELAKALKAAAAAPSLDSAALGTQVNAFAKDAWFMSESDYRPAYFAKAFPAGHDLDARAVMTALAPELATHFGDATGLLGDYTAKVFSPREAKAFMDRLTQVGDPNDPALAPNAQLFVEITRLVSANLKDLQVAKVGPKAADGTLASDRGRYAYVVIGRASDGKVAGLLLGAVET